jgi:hypothetical protein
MINLSKIIPTIALDKKEIGIATIKYQSKRLGKYFKNKFWITKVA